MRCHKCQEQMEEFLPDLQKSDWLKLMNYFDHELCEGEITDRTFESMTNALSSLYPEHKEVNSDDK